MATFQPWPIDAGFGNAHYVMLPGTVDFTTMLAVPTDLLFKLSCTSNGIHGQTESDAHSYGASYLGLLSPSTRYQTQPWPSPLIANFEASTTAQNPFITGATCKIQCETQGADVMINGATTGGLGAASGGTQALIIASPNLGVGN